MIRRDPGKENIRCRSFGMIRFVHLEDEEQVKLEENGTVLERVYAH